MSGKSNVTSPSFCCRRKFTILSIIGTLIILFFVIREKYFYRADVLIAMTAPVTSDNSQRAEVQIGSKVASDSGGGILGFLGFGSNSKDKKEKEEKKRLNVWDEWMLKHKEMTSIGDIYNKCDNKTRTKIGKVVLQPKSSGNGVEIKSFLNQTYDYEIVSSHAHMEVHFNGNLLYEKEKDMCEAAKLLDTPYSCPIKAGRTLVIADVAKMPSYIPKGKYRVFSNIIDQNKVEIGCTYIEFKTGNEES